MEELIRLMEKLIRFMEEPRSISAVEIINMVINGMTLLSVGLGYLVYRHNKKNPDINRKRFYWDFFCSAIS